MYLLDLVDLCAMAWQDGCLMRRGQALAKAPVDRRAQRNAGNVALNIQIVVLDQLSKLALRHWMDAWFGLTGQY